jgi:hypothetical protein
MTYLIVGLDRRTFAPWRQNIRAVDIASAKRIALGRAQAQGIDLVLAAVIGPNSSVLKERPDARAGRRPRSYSDPAAPTGVGWGTIRI